MPDKGVQIQPDSTGQIVRTLEVTVLKQDGTLQTSEMQVVSIADERGRILAPGSTDATLARMADTLDEILFVLRLERGL